MRLLLLALPLAAAQDVGKQRSVHFELSSLQVHRNGAPCVDCRIDWLPAISCAVEGRNLPESGPQQIARYKIVPSGNGLDLRGTQSGFTFAATVGEELVCAVAGQWQGWTREALAAKLEGQQGALPRAPTEILVVPDAPGKTSGSLSISSSADGRTWSYSAEYSLSVTVP
jgi:hypothetical protein